jgi:hypothetical protein
MINWRCYVEARSRIVAGLSILSAGTPMFFFGEEVATDSVTLFERCSHHFIENKVDAFVLTVVSTNSPSFGCGSGVYPLVTAECDTVYGPVQVDLDHWQAVLYSIIS